MSAEWTIAQLREKIRSMFPRLLRFAIMKGTKERKLSAIQATNLRDLKKEVQRGALYIVPEGPLKPLIRTQEEDTGHSSNRLATSSENEARRISKRENQSVYQNRSGWRRSSLILQAKRVTSLAEIQRID